MLRLIRRKLQTHLEIIERKNKEGMIYLKIMHIIMLAQSYNVNSQRLFDYHNVEVVRIKVFILNQFYKKLKEDTIFHFVSFSSEYDFTLNLKVH